jgi:ankyrin repeat protein
VQLQARILLGLARRRGKDNDILIAVHEAVEISGLELSHSDTSTRQICEATLRYLGPLCLRHVDHCGVGGSAPKDVPSWLYKLNPMEAVSAESLRMSAAIITGDIAVVEQLARKIDVNAANKYFGYPLHLAALFGCPDMARTLFTAGADLGICANLWLDSHAQLKFLERQDITCITGTAIRTACRAGNEDVVRFLLGVEATPASKDEFYIRVHEAAYGGNLELVQLFLSLAGRQYSPSQVHELRTHVFYIAALTLHIPMIEAMLAAGVCVNDEYTCTSQRPPLAGRLTGHTALHCALSFQKGRLDAIFRTVKLLLQRGADPNKYASRLRYTGAKNPLPDPSPVSQAIALRSLDLVKLLLEHGAEPHARPSGRSFFLRAVFAGSVPLARFFLQTHDLAALNPEPVFGAQVNVTRWTDGECALQRAAARGPVEMLEFLVSEVGVRKVGGFGANLVSAAMAHGNTETLEVLYGLGMEKVDPMHMRGQWKCRALPHTGQRKKRGVFGMMVMDDVESYQEESWFSAPEQMFVGIV